MRRSSIGQIVDRCRYSRIDDGDVECAEQSRLRQSRRRESRREEYERDAHESRSVHELLAATSVPLSCDLSCHRKKSGQFEIEGHVAIAHCARSRIRAETTL